MRYVKSDQIVVRKASGSCPATQEKLVKVSEHSGSKYSPVESEPGRWWTIDYVALKGWTRQAFENGKDDEPAINVQSSDRLTLFLGS